MAALLVALSVMAVLATAAMPVWHQLTQREKEEELVFRGNQYVRAIRLFAAKAGPGVLPPNLDVLLQQRYLRKKYRDPITGQEFDLLSPVQATAPTPGAPTPGAAPSSGRGGAAPAAGRGGAAPAAGRGGTPQPSSRSGAVIGPQAPGGRGGAAAGIMGVASKSKEASIRLYNGRNHYNEWQFLYVAQVQQAGGPGRGQPPGRGQGPGMPPGIGGPNRGGPGRQPGAPVPPPTPFGPGGRQTFPNPGNQPFPMPGTPRPQR
jgi:type II secretory pathway pseudopilin PulG